MNKHLILPNDSTVLLAFNKDARWIVNANGNILQLTPVANLTTPAGDFVRSNQEPEVVGRHVMLDITEVGTCDTLINQLTRVRAHLEKNGKEAKKAHIEALARQLADAQHDYRMAYGVPEQGPDHAVNVDTLVNNLVKHLEKGGAQVVHTQLNQFPEDMVQLARELNDALEKA